MMGVEDDDYMSAAFLDVKEDIRPGLVKSSTVKRKYQIEEKRRESHKRNQTKSIRQLEEEHRNAGLDASISSNNKGFAMLQKMGYKPGMTLGNQNKPGLNSGLKEPIRVEVKTDRGGLGRAEEIKLRIKEKEKLKTKIKVYKESETERLTEEFQKRMRDKVQHRHLVSDLNKFRKACEQLDVEKCVEAPIRPWFWYSSLPEEEDEDENDEDEETGDEELDLEDQLEFISDYLRGTYFYCVWCGTKYDDADDMAANCPGLEKIDHE